MKSPDHIDTTMLDDLLEMIDDIQSPQEFTNSSNENERKIESSLSYVCVCVCVCMFVCFVCVYLKKGL